MCSRPMTLVAGLVLLAAPASLAQERVLPEQFTLGRYIPEACWFYVHGVHNPDRAVIDLQWDRVVAAIDVAGLEAEVRRMIASALPDARQEDFERQWQAVAGVASQVNWSSLGTRECAVSMRIAPLPTHLLLLRGDPGSGPANLEALASLLHELAALNNKLSVEKKIAGKVRLWSLHIPGVPFSIQLFGRGDVVGVCTGETLTAETIALLDGRRSGPTILDSKRLQKALRTLPPPEDVVQFIDFRALFVDLNAMLEEALQQTHPDGEPPREGPAIFSVIQRLNVLDYVAMVQETDGLRELTHTVQIMRPDRLDAAFARVFRKAVETDDPLRYVPIDATAFTASAGLDWDELYAFVLGIIETDIPHQGPALLARWQAFQEQVGFDLQRDFLDWFHGETIRVSLPGRGAQPLGSYVWMLRVKDPERAWQKVRAAMAALDERVFRRYLNVPLDAIPATEVRSENFVTLVHPILVSFMLQPVVGVHGNWLVIGTSAGAVNKCLDTAAGKAPNITESPRYRREGITSPRGRLWSTSFSDLSTLGQDLSNALFFAGVVGGMIPDEPETRTVKGILALLRSLAPALAEIDFYSSASTATTFDGTTWRVEAVTTYKESILPEK